MESPSSASPAGDGSAGNREKGSPLKKKSAESLHPLENGCHGYHYMKNGKLRPSAVRDFPEGIVPIHRKESTHVVPCVSFSPEEKQQLQEALPATSKGKMEQKQTEETVSASASEEAIKSNADSGSNKEELKPGSEPCTDHKPITYSFKKAKSAQTENKRLSTASSDAAKANGKDIVTKKTQKTAEERKSTSTAEKKKTPTAKEGKLDKKEDVSLKKTESSLAKSSKLVERKTTSTVPDASLQEAEAKPIKEKPTKTGKSLVTTAVLSNSDVSHEAAEARSSKQEDTSVAETSKVPIKSGKPLEKKGREKASMASDALLQVGEVRATMEESTPREKTQKSPAKGIKSVEKEAVAAPSELQGTKEMEFSVSEGQMEAMEVKKQQEEEKAEKVIELSKKAEKVMEPSKKAEKVIEQSKKAQPVKRKSGIRDMPESLTQAKNKVAKEAVGQEHLSQDVEMEASPSKTKETAKKSAVADNGKLDGNANKKRPLEEPHSSEKSKKLPKLKPSNEAQMSLKAKEKEPKSNSPVQVVTPKSTKKPSTASESAKKVKRSAGKSARPATSMTDVSNARKLVLESLRLYDAVRRKFVQDEEKNGKQGRGSRSDLQAATLLKDQHATRFGEKGHGSLPGVLVGDIFLFRTELSFARVHGPIQGGIEYLTTKDSEFNTPVAISIISNVGQDGEDNGEELIYTGQGGRSADNKQIANQKLERGNLAMDGSRKFNIPIRVIRGIKDVNSPTGKIYVYDGLYNVQDTYTAKGSGGFDEFKFKLQRMPDQPELGSETLKLAADLKSQALSSRKGVVIVDISKGMESQAICVENTVDDDEGPAEFKYSTKVIYPDELKELESSDGCKCNGACTPSSSCSCFSRNGDELPYLNGGYLVRQKDFIYECGSKCSCSSSCRNRVSEKGMKFRLDVFKTPNTGWGVRSLEMIPAGSFVCEYVGKVVANEQDAKECKDRQHMLFTRWLPETTPRWGDVPSIIPDRSSSTTRPDVGKSELVIDASHVGNVARFINHSCSANLLAQKVLSEHQDVRYPRFKLFAIDNIPPLRELTLDYGYPPDQDLAMEEIECLCGSSDCRRKLYL